MKITSRQTLLAAAILPLAVVFGSCVDGVSGEAATHDHQLASGSDSTVETAVFAVG